MIYQGVDHSLVGLGRPVAAAAAAATAVISGQMVDGALVTRRQLGGSTLSRLGRGISLPVRPSSAQSGNDSAVTGLCLGFGQDAYDR